MPPPAMTGIFFAALHLNRPRLFDHIGDELLQRVIGVVDLLPA